MATAYTGLDFLTVSDDLLARLQVQFAESFNDFAVSSLAIVLIDLEAYGLDGLAFYLDKRAAETFLATARTRKAVSRICRQLGYKMRSAVSSSVDLAVAVPDVVAAGAVIPKGFLLKGPGDLRFEVARAVSYAANETGGAVTKSVPAFEGQTFTETFVSDGSANQTFELRRLQAGQYVVRGTVIVRVNGALWEESDLLTFDRTDQYEVGYNDDPPALHFGDAIAGNIPLTGATISVVYVGCSGKAGRVAHDTITEPVSPLTVNFTTVALTITNPSGSVGGDDPESLDEARQNAPNTWKARGVAIVRSDYEGLASSFADPRAGRVAVAQAFSTRGADQDLSLLADLRAIRAQVQAPIPPTTAALADLRSRLDAIRADLAALDASLTAVTGSTTTMDTALGGVQVTARQIETGASVLGTTAGSIASSAAVVKSTLATFTVVGAMAVENIRQATLNALNAQADGITAATNTVSTTAGNILGQVGSQISTLTTARANLRTLGLDRITTGTQLRAIELGRQDMVLQVGLPTPATEAYAQLAAIETAVIDSADSAYAVVDEACTSVFDHVDRILASDCKANLVTVPILARDAGGFYVAPSRSLIAALQGFLEDRCETTQTVQVVDGSGALVLAVLQIRVGVKEGYSLSLLQTAVQTLAEGVLRNRRFGQSLYVSDLDGIKQIEGVGFVNITILGYLSGDTLLVDKLDASGNLLVSRAFLITRGQINVAVEAQRTQQ